MKRRLYLLFTTFMMISGICAAESVWQGNASMSMYGEFPRKGFYAASDSFERNTLIEVKNLDNGKKTTVIVADRLSDSGLFLLLSREASQELGIKQDELARVEVTLSYPENGAVSMAADDRPYHPDPDVNPSAAVRGDYTVPEETEREEIPEEIPEVTAGEAPEEAPLSVAPAVAIAVPEAPSEEEEKEEKQPEEKPLFLGVTDLASAPEEEKYTFDRPEIPEGPAAALASREAEGTAEREIHETPEIVELSDTPHSAGIAFLDPAVPEEPKEPEESKELPEEDAEEPDVIEDRSEEYPQISGLEESPKIEPIGLYAMDMPELPEREKEAEQGPEVSELAASPETAGVQPIARLAVPVQPKPEIVDLETEQPEGAVLADVPLDLPSAQTARAEETPAEPPIEPPDSVADSEPEEEAILQAETTPEAGAAAEAEPEAEEEVETVREVPPLEEDLDKDADIVLRPAEPRPPTSGPPREEPPEPSSFEEPEIDAADIRYRFETTPMLARNSYYVQLGVFSEPGRVERVVSSLSPAFPVTVYKPSDLKYKVLLGPLNQDESGSVLFTIKAQGYADAFIRRGN